MLVLHPCIFTTELLISLIQLSLGLGEPPPNTHKEMDHLEDDAVVYKLVGPVLVRQELSEARQTVEKRLDYISKEL